MYSVRVLVGLLLHWILEKALPSWLNLLVATLLCWHLA
jgi:hypothetical protein